MRSTTLAPLVNDFLQTVDGAAAFCLIGSNGFINNLDLFRGQDDVAGRNVFLPSCAISRGLVSVYS